MKSAFSTSPYIHTKEGFYRSTEVCEITGATYRQLDYWYRNGKLSADGKPVLVGSGRQVFYSPAVTVVVRAYVIACSVVDPQHSGGGMKVDSRFAAIVSDVSRIYAGDPTLSNCWLVIEPDSARIVEGDWPTDGALFVDLSACARYVAEGFAMANEIAGAHS